LVIYVIKIILPNFGKEQQNNVHHYYIGYNEVQKLDIFGNKVSVHDNDIGYTVSYAATSLVYSSHSSPVASRVKLSMEARSCNFQTDSYKFPKEKIMGA